jgi:hypothetical protein
MLSSTPKGRWSSTPSASKSTARAEEPGRVCPFLRPGHMPARREGCPRRSRSPARGGDLARSYEERTVPLGRPHHPFGRLTTRYELGPAAQPTIDHVPSREGHRKMSAARSSPAIGRALREPSRGRVSTRPCHWRGPSSWQRLVASAAITGGWLEGPGRAGSQHL